MNSSHSAKFLLVCSCGYLSIPVLVFILGWLQAPFAFLGAAALLAGNLWLARANRFPLAGFARSAWVWLRANSARLLWLGVFTFALVLVSGIGGLSAQTADWYKHNAILKELAQANWPAFVQQDGAPYPLVYYLAYYLPAALVGKFLKSWLAINVLLLLWSGLGLALVFGWLGLLLHRFSAGVAALFIVFSGLDVMGVLASLPWQQAGFLPGLLESSHLDGWANSVQYSSMATLLIWVPQHAIAGWVLAGLCLYLYQHAALRRHFAFVWALSLLWSPFVSLGLGVFLLADLWAGGLSSRVSWKSLAGQLPGGLLALLVLSFFASPLSGANRELGFSFSTTDSPSPWLVYPLFVLVEFALYAILIWTARAALSARERKLFLVSCAFLALLPLLRLGVFNDLVMRASIPALFILALFVLRLLLQPRRGKALRVAMLVLFVVGCLTPFFEYKRQISRTFGGERLSATRAFERVDSLDELLEEENYDVSGYYLGNPEAWFFSKLAQPRR